MPERIDVGDALPLQSALPSLMRAAPPLLLCVAVAVAACGASSGLTVSPPDGAVDGAAPDASANCGGDPCDPAWQYCHIDPASGPRGRCRVLPRPCAAAPTCACLDMQSYPGCAVGPSCTSSGGLATVVCPSG